MLRKANNVFSVLLNDGTITAAAVTATCPVGTVATPANVPAGAVILVDAGMRRLDYNTTSGANYVALADGDKFFTVQGRGTSKSFMKSPALTKGKTKFTISRHKPAVQQVTIVGYNGTTGALPAANNTNFFIKIRKRDNDAANRSQPFSLFAGPVRTDATGTQLELATLLLKNGTKNFKDEPANNYLKFEMICDAAGAVPTGTTTLFTATNGSKTVAIDGTLTNVAVGDYIRLEGTTTASAVYKVIAYTASTSITLDTAYTGVSGAYAIANTRRITAVLAAAANFGISLTGIAANFDVNQFRDYYANRFTATFSDVSTLVSHMVGAYNGNGTFQQVAMDEYMSYGYEGEMQQLSTPSVPRDQFVKVPGIGTNTVLSSRYSSLSIAWEESISGLVSMDGGKGSVLIYLNLDSTSPLGLLDTGTANNGETFVQALGLTAANFDMV
jgi:hypothetical protein